MLMDRPGVVRAAPLSSRLLYLRFEAKNGCGVLPCRHWTETTSRATYYATRHFACVADVENSTPNSEITRRNIKSNPGPIRPDRACGTALLNPSNPPVSSSLILGGLRRVTGAHSSSPCTAEPEASDGVHQRGAIQRHGTLLPSIQEHAGVSASGLGS